jgi:uncharacterized membrane protein YccC
MTADSVTHTSAPPSARAKLKLVAAVMVPAWARAVVVLIGVAVLAKLVGLGDEAGYAIIPGFYIVLSPPAGPVAERVQTVVVASLLVACLTAVGAALSQWTVAVTLGLVLVGFVAGLLPRVGPRAATMQLPLLVAFAYSAAFPLTAGSVGARVAAVLVALPVYVLAAAILFQTDPRRPLLLGAAAGLGGVADALEHAGAREGGAAREAELGLVKFRVATGRLKEAAVPTGGSLDSRAGRLLFVSVQEALAAAELVASDAGERDARPRERIATLSGQARGLAGALSRGAPAPPPGPLEELARSTRRGDPVLGSLAEALADIARAVAVLHGEAHELPTGLVAELPGAVARVRGALTLDDPIFRQALRLAAAAGLAGLVASLLDLTRTYWSVFAVVAVLNAPPALGTRRALMRIGGTVLGLLLAIGLLQLLDHHTTLAFILALVLLLPGLLLMPINYGAAMVFITSMVALLFSAGGEETDFLKFRVLDNAVGVAIVAAVGVLMWRASRADWWRVAGLTARSLARAIESDQPAQRRDELVTRALQLRTETVNAAALPDGTPAFVASWTFLAAAENLIRMLVGPKTMTETAENRSALAADLRAIVARCSPTDAAAQVGGQPPEPPSTLAGLAVTRMGTAVALLHQQDTSNRQSQQ